MGDLQALLKAAAQHTMTAEEIFEQKVSFIYGQLMDANPNVTKDEIRKRLQAGAAMEE